MLEKRTIFTELLESIKVWKEIAVTGKSHITEKDLIHMCYTEFDCGYIDTCQLRTLLEKI